MDVIILVILLLLFGKKVLILFPNWCKQTTAISIFTYVYSISFLGVVCSQNLSTKFVLTDINIYVDIIIFISLLLLLNIYIYSCFVNVIILGKNNYFLIELLQSASKKTILIVILLIVFRNLDFFDSLYIINLFDELLNNLPIYYKVFCLTISLLLNKTMFVTVIFLNKFQILLDLFNFCSIVDLNNINILIILLYCLLGRGFLLIMFCYYIVVSVGFFLSIFLCESILLYLYNFFFFLENLNYINIRAGIMPMKGKLDLIKNVLDTSSKVGFEKDVSFSKPTLEDKELYKLIFRYKGEKIFYLNNINRLSVPKVGDSDAFVKKPDYVRGKDLLDKFKEHVANETNRRQTYKMKYITNNGGNINYFKGLSYIKGLIIGNPLKLEIENFKINSVNILRESVTDENIELGKTEPTRVISNILRQSVLHTCQSIPVKDCKIMDESEYLEDILRLKELSQKYEKEVLVDKLALDLTMDYLFGKLKRYFLDTPVSTLDEVVESCFCSNKEEAWLDLLYIINSYNLGKSKEVFIELSLRDITLATCELLNKDLILGKLQLTEEVDCMHFFNLVNCRIQNILYILKSLKNMAELDPLVKEVLVYSSAQLDFANLEHVIEKYKPKIWGDVVIEKLLSSGKSQISLYEFKNISKYYVLLQLKNQCNNGVDLFSIPNLNYENVEHTFFWYKSQVISSIKKYVNSGLVDHLFIVNKSITPVIVFGLDLSSIEKYVGRSYNVSELEELYYKKLCESLQYDLDVKKLNENERIHLQRIQKVLQQKAVQIKIIKY